MKKIKILVLAGVVATAMMGAGYAAWSDQTFLTSTVSTGNFSMEITEATTRTGDQEASHELHQGKVDGDSFHAFDWTHQAAVPVIYDGNSAVVEFKDLYPGGTVQVDMTQINKGTLPAKLTGAKVEYLEGNGDVFNLLRAQTSWKADIDGNGTQDDWSHVEGWKYWRPIQDALNALVADTTADNLVIEPNGYFKLGDGTEDGCIKFKLDSTASNDLQNKSVKFKITFTWDQWATDPMDNQYDGPNGYGGDGDITGTPNQTPPPR